jgi:hypothetical protein
VLGCTQHYPIPLGYGWPVAKSSISHCRRRRKESLIKFGVTPLGTRWLETPYVVSYMALVLTLSLAVQAMAERAHVYWPNPHTLSTLRA